MGFFVTSHVQWEMNMKMLVAFGDSKVQLSGIEYFCFDRGFPPKSIEWNVGLKLGITSC